MQATFRPWHTVRVDRADGKQSLMKLPDDQFVHLALVLQDRRMVAPAQEIAIVEAVAAPDGPPSAPDQAFALAASVISRMPI